ncbi:MULTISPECIES: hypothetical protein [unclassified Streptomyces]|uniref:hypothetical protein n=1 Tax=unclassified Streptomyces TaxID=2593676 RepID=UPI00331C3A18
MARDAAALARRSTEPSDLSLLGLVRHMAGVEHGHADFLRERIDGRAGRWTSRRDAAPADSARPFASVQGA